MKLAAGAGFASKGIGLSAMWLVTILCWFVALVAAWCIITGSTLGVLAPAYFGVGPALVATACLMFAIDTGKPWRYLMGFFGVTVVAFAGVAILVTYLAGTP